MKQATKQHASPTEATVEAFLPGYGNVAMKEIALKKEIVARAQ